MSDWAWSPSAAVVEHARITEFLRLTECSNFEELHRWSVTNVEQFTEVIIRFLNIHFDRPYDSVLDLSHGPEWPRWCVGADLNIVQSCLQHEAQQMAVIADSEREQTVALKYGELREQVSTCAAGLKHLGIGNGDRVGIYMSMRVETVVALLAIGYIGAIAVPLFSGYGPAAIETRLNQTAAKALITCQEFQRAGKRIEMLDVAREALRRCDTVERLITVGSDSWKNLFSHGSAPYERTAAEDPLIIVFSSGTTGEPKGIVHSHCSFPIKAAQDMALNMDVHARDRISWITDLGWMMGPWLIYGSLILGATMVLYDGACDWPGPDALWRLASRRQLDVLGISPSLVRRVMEHGLPRTTGCDLSGLRFFASSGECWDPASWSWLFREVRKRPVPIINYSGGTEISGGILSNHPLAPMKPCGFAAPCPGMAADIVDEQGGSIVADVGELAIRRSWIGQARGFWNDPERYIDSYWSRVPGVWIHGDWAERDSEGAWFIHGRSDDTLKIAGKRVGPAEIEKLLLCTRGITEAAVIGIPDDSKGTAIVAMCVGQAIDPGTVQKTIAMEFGKPFTPKRIYVVRALPKTRNGKIVRRAIRAAYLHTNPGDLSALENPEALNEIRNLNI